MVRVKVRSAVFFGVPESPAVIVKFEVPAVVGRPLITPVVEFSASPGGSVLPLAKTNV